MKIESKKMEMAERMYKQNSTGGKGTSPKNYQNGKETKSHVSMKYEMNGKNTGSAKGQKYSQADKSGKFGADKYEQANEKGSMRGGYKMANC